MSKEDQPKESQSRETQHSITAWAEHTFGPVSDLGVLVTRAATELDELLDAVKTRDSVAIGKETADVVILLMRLLEQSGLDLSDELNKKMQENRNRIWTRKGDGTGSHVKPSPSARV